MRPSLRQSGPRPFPKLRRGGLRAPSNPITSIDAFLKAGCPLEDSQWRSQRRFALSTTFQRQVSTFAALHLTCSRLGGWMSKLPSLGSGSERLEKGVGPPVPGADAGRLARLRLHGRCLDLKSAYRQLAVHSEDLRFSVISLRAPGKMSPTLFISRALPFGATAAVYAFNRCARAIAAILSFHLAIPCGNFFDDFPVVEPEETAGGSQEAAHELLRMLGWVFAEDPKKCQPPLPKFDVLGASLDLSAAHTGVVRIDNKETRKAALLVELDSLEEAGQASAKAAASLRGKLLFFEGQLTGKCMVAATWCIGQLALGLTVHPDEVKARCAWLREFLLHAPPREISFFPSVRPVLVFTDGAAEDSGVSCGAVVFDPVSRERWVFHVPVPLKLVSHWQSNGSKHVVSQAELLPVLLVLHTFPKMLRNRRLLFFVDNEGVRFSLIKGASRAELSRDMVLGVARMVAHLCCLPWYLRVPSESNPADAPSRGDLEPALRVSGTKVANVVWPEFLLQWVD